MDLALNNLWWLIHHKPNQTELFQAERIYNAPIYLDTCCVFFFMYLYIYIYVCVCVCVFVFILVLATWKSGGMYRFK